MAREQHSPEETSGQVGALVGALPFASDVRRIAVALTRGGDRPVDYFTFRPVSRDGGTTVMDDDLVRGIHPMVGRRLNLWRLRDFGSPASRRPRTCCSTTRGDRQPGRPAARRAGAGAPARRRTRRGRDGHRAAARRARGRELPEAIRRARTERPDGAKLDLNHVWVHVWPVVEAEIEQLTAPRRRSRHSRTAPASRRCRRTDARARPGRGVRTRSSYGSTRGSEAAPSRRSSRRRPSGLPLDDYAGKVLRARRRGLVYPYELEAMLTGPDGSLVEYDLDDTGALVPVTGPAA